MARQPYHPPCTSPQLYIELVGVMAKFGHQPAICLHLGLLQLLPPQLIIMQAGSRILSIMNVVTASSDGALAEQTPLKGNVPKHKYPDFSCTHSKDNTILSGDESGEWDNEVDNVTAKVTAENAMELLAACNLEDLVEEVMEIDYLLEDVEVGEEGKADDEGGEMRGGGLCYLVGKFENLHSPHAEGFL
jgi:hypothetical protein